MVESIKNINIGTLEEGCSFGESELIIKMRDMEMNTIGRDSLDSTNVREYFYNITLTGNSNCSIHNNGYGEIDHQDPNYQGYRSQLEGAGLW